MVKRGVGGGWCGGGEDGGAALALARREVGGVDQCAEVGPVLARAVALALDAEEVDGELVGWGRGDGDAAGG